MNGEVIGINSAVSQGQGIGFAIPINMAKTLLPMLKAKGHIERSYLGVNIQDISRDLATSLRLTDAHGALVAGVVPGSPADKAGLRAGDVVVAFDGKPIHQSEELTWLTSVTGAGKQITLGVVGARGAHDVKVTLGAAADAGAHVALASGRRGLDAVAVNAEIAHEARPRTRSAGVVVASVDRASPVAGHLFRGDVIVAVNDQLVNDEATLLALTKDLRRGSIVKLRIVREGTPMWLAFTLP